MIRYIKLELKVKRAKSGIGRPLVIFGGLLLCEDMMVTAVSPWETEAAETLQERMARLRDTISSNSTSDDKHQQNKKQPHRWKPGESGNPNGRPPGDKCITSITKEMLSKPAVLPPDAPEFMEGWTWAQLISYNFIISGVKQVPPILKELLDRTEGKVTTPIEATGKDGAPLFDGAVLIEKLNIMAGADDD